MMASHNHEEELTMGNNANPVHPAARTIELNIGLLASEHAVDRAPLSHIDAAQAELAVRDRLHFPVLGEFKTRVETGGSEPALVVRARVLEEDIQYGRLSATVYGLSVALEQDAIAVYFVDGHRAGTGRLIGPNADPWGEFNPEFFSRFDPA